MLKYEIIYKSISNTGESLEYETLTILFFTHTRSSKRSKMTWVDMKKELITFNRGGGRGGTEKKEKLQNILRNYKL